MKKSTIVSMLSLIIIQSSAFAGPLDTISINKSGSGSKPLCGGTLGAAYYGSDLSISLRGIENCTNYSVFVRAVDKKGHDLRDWKAYKENKKLNDGEADLSVDESKLQVIKDSNPLNMDHILVQVRAEDEQGNADSTDIDIDLGVNTF